MRKGNLFIYDPKVSPEQIESDLNQAPCKILILKIYLGWFFSRDIINAIESSDAIVVLTEWEEFKSLDWELIAHKMRSPSWVFDARSIINISEAKKQGINVWELGMGSQSQSDHIVVKKLISKEDHIFIAGGSGMVGSSIYRNLIEQSYGIKKIGRKISIPSRRELNLLSYNQVYNWFELNKPISHNSSS